MEKNKYFRISLFVIPFLIIFLVYSQMLKGFFQQDEWFSYGWYVIHRNLNVINMLKFFFAPDVGHYNPLTVAIQQILFSFWNLNYTYFSLLGVISHLLVVFGVFFLAKEIFKKDEFIAVAVAFFFGILASIYQGVTWAVADISTLWASIFGLVSAILFIKFIRNRNPKFLLSSLILVFVSLFLKEITIGLFPLYFVCLIFFGEKKLKIKSLIYISLVAIFYISIRGLMLFLPHANSQNVVTESEGAGRIIYDFITSPVKSVSQTLLPQNVIESLSKVIAEILPRKISGVPGTSEFDDFVLKRVGELFSLVTGLLFLCGGLLVLIKRKMKPEVFPLFFGIFWTILNSFIFSFSPGRNGVVFLIDSRNLYFVAIGVSICVIYLLKSIAGNNRIKFLLFMFPLLVLNLYFLSVNIQSFNDVGNLRRGILDQIVDKHPILPSKTVFYIESDISYYGLPENIRTLPFQSGFGQTLLAWYEKTENFPTPFFEDSFLWPIESQGYKEVGGRGFGYFRDFSNLANFFATNNATDKRLISYSYTSADNILKDNTNEVQGRIDGYTSKKRLIDLVGSKITASDNNKDIYKAIDGNRNTKWESDLTYDHYMNLVFDLKKNYRIAELTIDSYNDPNQNAVGYRVLVSNDDKVWRTEFESRKYPPVDGKVNIYIEPTDARFVKIEQIGSHKYAHWVVNEIMMYEKI